MQDRPAHVDESELLALVRAHWDPDVDALDHQPVGFGAHHWRATAGGEARWFVTVDELGRRHDAKSLESAYAGAASLHAAGLDFLHVPAVAGSGTYTLPLPAESHRLAVSVTPWLGDAREPGAPGAEAELLARLHAARPVPLPEWAPRVPASFVDDLAVLLDRPWTDGPLGEEARALTADRRSRVEGWYEEYAALSRTVDPDEFVVTHGEPGVHNQLVTGGRVVLVDTESLMLAPAERDVSGLWPVGRDWLDRYGSVPRQDRLRLFDLEWVLTEVDEYTAWLGGPHSGGPDDVVALGGLRTELDKDLGQGLS
ncbi:aminoglycoside phosphotransferase family protein [Streptomyces sp. NPDC057245]|uniref:aminoglycoside phosphotransferase family protein n=1 Tax=Streptomyces TaxID=1883 RepID=UPI001C1E5CB4|nr:aminoglycoside phosphotransferase family protein [Streptomyces sp. A108]MBU6533616.1 aminoglycoside phosphotransferase [Streptomyces sp. A108]